MNPEVIKKIVAIINELVNTEEERQAIYNLVMTGIKYLEEVTKKDLVNDAEVLEGVKAFINAIIILNGIINKKIG